MTDRIADALERCTLAWPEEFDGTAGSSPDPGTWRAETGGHGGRRDRRAGPGRSVTFPRRLLVGYVRVYARP